MATIPQTTTTAPTEAAPAIPPPAYSPRDKPTEDNPEALPGYTPRFQSRGVWDRPQGDILDQLERQAGADPQRRAVYNRPVARPRSSGGRRAMGIAVAALVAIVIVSLIAYFVTHNGNGGWPGYN